MGSPVVIFGSGDFARIVSVYLDDDSDHDVVAFTVDEQYRDTDSVLGRPVVPYESVRAEYPPDEVDMLVAVGYSRVNAARAEAFDRCRADGYRLVSYVSSRAYRSPHVTIGENCVVFEANVLQPFVTIGDDCVLWSGNHIGHDVRIGNHVFIASHAVLSGNVTIGDRCFVGVNATFRDGVTVGDGCVIGASATVMKDTAPGEVLSVRHTEPRPARDRPGG